MTGMARCLVALALLLGPPGTAAAQIVEYNTNRLGGDFDRVDMGNGIGANPRACANICEGHDGCESWTYVHPGVQGPTAQCWLKKVVPAPVSDTCCDSGVIHIGPAPSASELTGWDSKVNLPGSDIRSLPAASPSDCRIACVNEPACRAWTYVYPGIQGPSGMCWLKSSVPTPVASGCCLSGRLRDR